MACKHIRKLGGTNTSTLEEQEGKEQSAQSGAWAQSEGGLECAWVKSLLNQESKGLKEPLGDEKRRVSL